MKHHTNDLRTLRDWLVEDTDSEAEASQLLPVVEKLQRLSGLVIDQGEQAALALAANRRTDARQLERGSQRTVVCIDDDPAMLDLTGLILKHRGFEVIGATNGRQGLELISNHDPDLVLLDLMMPEMDGWDVYQRMKADEAMRTVPVIVVTAKSQKIDKVLGLNIARVQDYITKPFSPSELIMCISRVLGDAA